MRAKIDTPAARADSTGITTAALEPEHVRRAGLTMILFRDDRCGCDTLVAVLSEVMRGFAERYPLIQIDVRDRPALAALYNVRTTPTILLVKNGHVVDRVVGTPTRILLQSLLDARMPRGAVATTTSLGEGVAFCHAAATPRLWADS